MTLLATVIHPSPTDRHVFGLLDLLWAAVIGIGLLLIAIGATLAAKLRGRPGRGPGDRLLGPLFVAAGLAVAAAGLLLIL
ncbi:hypothetical protein [Kitasatospora cinereorecta]|uniref:DUF4190 domain-containing protein n=1 Tax=Kitasatospora cinereorecta TaxID=285560 RepID=A0ABW0VGI8_9ACTN